MKSAFCDSKSRSEKANLAKVFDRTSFSNDFLVPENGHWSDNRSLQAIRKSFCVNFSTCARRELLATCRMLIVVTTSLIALVTPALKSTNQRIPHCPEIWERNTLHIVESTILDEYRFLVSWSKSMSNPALDNQTMSSTCFLVEKYS